MYRPFFSQSGEYFVVPVRSDEMDGKRCELVVFKICKADNYKRGITGDELQSLSTNSENNDVISIEEVNRHSVDISIDDYFMDVMDLWKEKQPIYVDNKGNTVFFNQTSKIFQINGNNQWGNFCLRLKEKGFNIDDFDIYKFGSGTMVIKQREDILLLKFNEKNIVSSKFIKHKAVDIEGQCDLKNMVFAKNPRYLIIFYDINETKTIIVWDTEKDIEHTNFFGRKDDKFLDYITGKKSLFGFLCFNHYIVDLELGVPIPFMSMKFETTDMYWGQGMRINSSEDVMLGNGTIITPLCYKDIYFYKNKSLDNLDIQKVVYYMNKKSAAFEHIDNYDNLKKILEVFESNPLYCSMLLLENNDGKSPLQLAIENNSTRIIELMLNSLLKLDHFSLSNKIFHNFSTLFKMNLRSFEKYLNSCYFVTEQMRSINKLDLNQKEETIRDHFTCSILDKEFFKKYNVPDKDGNIPGQENKEIKPNQIAPSEKQGSLVMADHSQTYDLNHYGDDEEDKVNVFEEKENTFKRVSIKGIEFDWIFQSEN